MLEHEAGPDMRLVRQISAGMRIQAGAEHIGCSSSKVGESQESQVICVQCQDELVRVCPGSPRSPRSTVATRLSSGSAGADFTNTFRLLSRVPWPEEGDCEREAVGPVVDLILQQCSSIEELKVANKPTMEDRELAMILSMAHTNPAMFSMAAGGPGVAQQLERIGRLKELLETDQDELKEKQSDDWTHWVRRYRRRLSRECDDTSNLSPIKKQRLSVMNSNNPRVVLRNYIAQNAIQAAEKGDFSEVNRVLKALEDPYSDTSGLEPLDGSTARGEKEQREMDLTVGYDRKPPTWAQRICIT
ncbi:unnamed protein product [Pleuronectes platessa]|uniref:Selenoprotein O n=1 Tax=Pleuronectes platessa TaxID=8262 RepID=A0A9N7U7I0_PLEPL|nr:unnamed protein product [Pleuronectes platessa]